MKSPLSMISRRSSYPTTWRAMVDLENEMDRLMSSRWGSLSRFSGLPEGFDFAPMSDFQETDKEYVLKMDIPGIKKQDVKIEVEGNNLTIRGERHEETEEKGAKLHYSEMTYGSFLRSFTLPQGIEESKVKAQYSDGVLKVTVPKSSKSTTKTVPIQ